MDDTLRYAKILSYAMIGFIFIFLVSRNFQTSSETIYLYSLPRSSVNDESFVEPVDTLQIGFPFTWTYRETKLQKITAKDAVVLQRTRIYQVSAKQINVSPTIRLGYEREAFMDADIFFCIATFVINLVIISLLSILCGMIIYQPIRVLVSP